MFMQEMSHSVQQTLFHHISVFTENAKHIVCISLLKKSCALLQESVES